MTNNKQYPDLPEPAMPESKGFCCGNFSTGAEYMGQTEEVCCGNPDEAWPGHYSEAQVYAAIDADRAMRAAQPKCLTCNGHGMVGGLLPGDGGYDGQDCPDCNPAQPDSAAVAGPVMYVSARECSECNHVGINDDHETNAACNDCGWSGPSPIEDRCPGCERGGTMTAACPKCSGSYRLLAEETIAAPTTQAPQPVEPVVSQGEPGWLSRLRAEQGELAARYTKLHDFRQSAAFRMLDGTDQGLMDRQENQMHALLQTLNQRINGASVRHLRSMSHD